MADKRQRNSKGQFTKTDPNKITAGSWFKNAAKSLGYAGLDVLKTTMPTTMETIDVNREFATDLVKSIRANKGSKKFGSIEAQLTGAALENWKDLKTAKSNAISDLKSGKFYNKEREKALIDDEFGDFGDFDDFSFDMSDDLDDSNFDDSGDVKVVSPDINITTNINKDNPMVKAVQQQTRMLADTEAASSKRNIAIAETQMKLDKELTSVLYSGMETINSNLSILVNFNNEHVSGYIGASLKYYEDNIRYLSEISDNIKKIGGLVEAQNDSSDNTHNLDRVLESEGGLNIKNYMELVKKQFNNTLDENLFIGPIKAMLQSEGSLKAFMGSPLTFLPQMVISKLMPEFLTSSLQSLDKSFKSFIPAMLNKMGSWADSSDMSDGWGILKGFFGSIFGIKNTGKTSIDTANFERGAVPFDGITRKSIVEVIPGYLSKILSALTGKDELIFDMDTGKYSTKTNALSSFETGRRNAALSGYGDVKRVLDNRVKAFEGNNTEISKDLENFLVRLAEQKEFFNPHETDSFISMFDKLIPDSLHKDKLRVLFESLDPSQLMELVGTGHFNARRSLTDYIERLEKSGNMAGIASANNLFGDDANYLKNNPLINSFNQYASGSDKPTKVGSIFAPSDKYGKNNLDYLRDIYKTLLEGIGVWQIEPVQGRLDKFNRYLTEHDSSINRYTIDGDNRTEEQKAEDRERGIGIIGDNDMSSMSDSQLVEKLREFKDIDEGSLTSEQSKKFTLSRVLKFFFGSKTDRGEVIADATDQAIGKVANTFRNIANNIDIGLYRIVFGTEPVGVEGKKRTGLFSELKLKFKTWLFGEKDDEGKTVGKGGLVGRIKEFGSYLKDKFFEPLKEAFIGENGIITKFKQSKLYENMTSGIKTGITKLFGEVGEDGYRTGGKISQYLNTFSSYVKGTNIGDITINENGEYINTKTGQIITDKNTIDKFNARTGNEDPTTRIGGVFGNIKDFGTSFKNNIKEWLFGSDQDKTKQDAKGLLSDVGEYFKQGFQGFSDAIFGQSFDKEKNEFKSNLPIDELIGKIKERAPKAAASGIVGGGIGALAGIGGFGILGSLFLGPMSGVVIGTAAGFLSQSDKFKNLLFGEKDDNGERIGGLISKSTQNFFKEHKGAIIGGTALGALKGIAGIGILPSFILGGPITGALFGLGASLVTKSEMFQNMLFGEKINENGDRAGGVIGKITGSINNNEDIKKKLGFAGAGVSLGAIGGLALSSFGILGGIAFGPLTGAIVGAGAGIALAANKWKDAIFGKFDEKTGERTENGILSKMMAAVSVEVLQPAKVQITEWAYNVQDWFGENIAEPFLDSIEPIKEEVKRFKDRILEFGKGLLDKLHITQAFESMNEGIKTGFTNISKFVKDTAKKAIEGIGKFTGFIVSSPFKLIHAVADKILLPKHMKEGIAAVRDKIIDNIKESDFVKKVITPISETVKGTFIEVRDFAKQTIKNTFKYLLKGIGFLGKKLLDGVTAPFKGIGEMFKLGKKGVDWIKSKSGNGSRDTNTLEAIMSSGEGNRRGFGQSVVDLARLANPFSSLRRAAQYSENGASYQDERVAKRNERAEQRRLKREEHAANITRMREQLTFNQETARNLGYNLISDKDKEAMSFKKYNKMIDKEYGSAYGKEYKGMTAMQKDTFKETKATNNAIAKTETNTKDTATGIKKLIDLFLRGIKIRKDDFTGEEKSNFLNHGTQGTTEAEAKSENGISVSEEVASSSGDKPGFFKKLGGLFSGESKSDYLKHGTQGTTEFEHKSERQAEEERLKRQGVFHRIAGLLEIGNKENREHNSAWDFIFSKKGLLTAGILAAIPLLSKFLNGGWKEALSSIVGTVSNTVKNAASELFGFKDDDGNRTDITGDIQTNDDSIETAAMGAAKVGTKAAYIATNTATQIGSGVGKVGKIVTKLTGGPKFSTKQVATALGTSVDDVAETFGKKTGKISTKQIAKKLGSSTDDVAKMMKNVPKDDGIIKKFLGLLDTGIKKLSEWFTKKFPKFMDNKIVKTVFSALKKVLGSSAKKLGTFVDDIVKGITKVTGSAATGLILDAGFVLYGGITGATKTETANLFGVSQDDVDGKMQTASGLLKALLSFSWFFVITLASDISVAFGGPDIVRLLAQALYSLLVGGDIDKLQELSAKQNDFKLDFEQYTGVQQLLNGNAEIVTNEDGTQSISIKDQSKVTESMDSFNDRTNKSIAGKALEGIKTGWTNVKTFFTGQKGDEEAHAKAQAQLDQLNSLVEQGLISVDDPAYIETKKSLEKQLKATAKKGGFVENIKGVGKSIKNGVSKAGSAIKNGAIAVKNKVTDFLKPVTDFLAPYTNMGKELATYAKDTLVTLTKMIFTDNVNTDNLVISNDDPLGSIKKILYYAIKVPMTPIALVGSIGKKVFNGIIKPVINYASEMGKGIFDANLLDSLKGDGIFSSEYWTAPNDESNPLNGLRKVAFIAQRVLTAPAGFIMSVGKLAWDKVIKPVGEGILNLGKGMTDANLLDSLNGNGIFSSEYWTPPEDESNPIGVLGKIGFYANRVLTAPAGFIMSVGKLAWDNVIKPVGEGILNLGKIAMDTNVTDALKDDGIFSSEYWTPPEDESNPVMNGLGKATFFVKRILTAPAGLVLTATKFAATGVSKLWSGIKSVGDVIKSATKIDGLTVKNYWSYKDKDDGGPLSGMNKVLFYIGRGIMSPAFYIKQALGTISEKVKGAFNSVAEFLGLDDFFKDHTKKGKGGGIGGSIEEDMLNEYKVNSNYSPSRTINGVTKAHRGIDLSKGKKSKIYSFTDGIVDKVSSGFAPNSGYYGNKDGGGFGNYVRVVDGAGNYNYYAHLDGVNVKEGQQVKRGTQLGIEGNTGSSTGYHLHYEVRSGGTSSKYAVDPVKYLKNYKGSNTIGLSGSTTGTESAESAQTGIQGLVSALSSQFNGLLSPLTNITSKISEAFNGLLGNNNTTSTTDSSNITPSSSGYTTTTKGSSTAETIYKFLRSKGVTPAGAAGMLGVWQAESGLIPNNLENGYAKSLNYTDDSYTNYVDKNGRWPERGMYGNDYYNGGYKLLDNRVGYGLAQWSDAGRKDALLKYAKAHGKSIGDLEMQLNFAWDELNNGNKEYAKVLKRVMSTNNPEDAALGMLVDYEMPGWNDAKGKSSSFWPARRDYANAWYKKFAGMGGEVESTGVDTSGRNILPGYTSYKSKSLTEVLKSANITSTNNASISERLYEYLKQIVDVLKSINSDTHDTAVNTEEIKNKKPETNTAIIDASKKETNSPMFDIASNRRSNKANKAYQNAKAIASGN